MQGKTKTYVLLIAVLAVWGTIGYKIVSGLNPEEPELETTTFDVAFNPKQQTKRDTFSIQAPDRDPFLGTLRTRKKATKKSTKKTVVKDTAWMPISYKGLVKRQNSSEQVFVININNQQHLVKRGQTVNDVKIVKGNDKSITLRYKNNNKTFKIQ